MIMNIQFPIVMVNMTTIAIRLRYIHQLKPLLKVLAIYVLYAIHINTQWILKKDIDNYNSCNYYVDDACIMYFNAQYKITYDYNNLTVLAGEL